MTPVEFLPIPCAALLEALPDPAVIKPASGDVLLVNSAFRRAFDPLIRPDGTMDAAAFEETLRRNLVEARMDTQTQRKPSFAERLFWLDGGPRRLVRHETYVIPGAALQLEWWRRLDPPEDQAAAEKRLTESLRAQVDRLQSKLEQAELYKEELTANVSHDLKTPLASIKASVSGLLDAQMYRNPELVRETLMIIDDATDRLLRRVQNLLALARCESGSPASEQDYVDLGEVVRAACESLGSLLANRQVQFDLDDPPLIRGDYIELEVAVRNLIENACLYSPAGQPIEISTSASLGSARIRVRDYGPGLDPEEMERAFEKFYRGREARRVPGTGIGLAICRGIAQAHGGRLWAEHAEGGGVVFVLSLPMEEEAELVDAELASS